MAKDNFHKISIEDAFEEDTDDAICLYGATNQSSMNRQVSSSNPALNSNRSITGGTNIQRGNISVPFTVIRKHSAGLLDRMANRDFIPVSTDPDNTSRDSESLLQGSSVRYDVTDSAETLFNNPSLRKNWKVVAGAFALFFLGSVLLIMAVVIQTVPLDALSSLPFYMAGIICFIPGLYHCVYIVFAAIGCRGYDFYNIPFFS